MIRIAALCVVALGCSSQPGDGPGNPDSGATSDAGDSADSSTAGAWADVTAELETSFPGNGVGVDGLTLLVFDDQDNRVYERTVGSFSPDQRVGIASATKLVTGLALMRLIDSGDLALTDTTGDVLGWTGANSGITLDHLGAFVSGLRPQFLCVFQANITLADCVDTIEAANMPGTPGAQLAYGNVHLHVAARMGEVVTGLPWQQVADEQLFVPLGISTPGLEYAGNANPGVAGLLQATANEYAEILALLYNKGNRDGTQLIAEQHIDRMTINPYTSAVVETSPYADGGFTYRYGFSSWLECDGAVPSCDVVSSAGAAGFTPWVDYDNNYYAVLAMQGTVGDASVFSVELQHRLKPLIVQALAR